MRGRGPIIVLAAVAVLIAFLARGRDDDGGGRPATGPSAGGTAPSGPLLRVAFVHSPEKAAMLEPLIARYNAERHRAGGATVQIVGRNLSSGQATDDIGAGRLKPALWSPASSLWGRLLNYTADRRYAPERSPSLVSTPLVVAMWEPMARALGWPAQRVGFEQLLRLATSRRGWAAYGHREFGPFKLGHTNPDFSTAGLSAVAAEYYAARGKREGLTVADVERPAVRDRIRRIERSIVHYGDTTLFIADQMRRQGPGYASAVAMEEVTLLDFNRDRAGQPRLVALYPPEGTFYSDNPFIVLDAPWVSAKERAAAGRFQEFLADRIDPELAARSGFRPADTEQEPVAPVSKENGVDPAQPERVLGLPEPRVLDAIKRIWREDRKPANVMLVVDTSGSMADENRLARAKEGLQTFFEQVGRQDSVGLTIFSDVIQPLIAVGPFRDSERELRSTVRNLIADGGTAVYDATIQAFEDMRGRAGPDRINAVVVLTDGEDTDSSADADEVAQAVRAQGDSDEQVRVFTIAYSAGAAGAADALQAISEASGGQPYEGDTEDIEAVYRSISSFF